MKPNELIGLVIALASALVTFLAWLIKYRKIVSMISGYDEKLYRDKDGLANWVGGTLLITGLTGILLAVAIIILPQYIMPLVICFSTALLGGSLTAAIGGNKYKVKGQ